MEIWCLSWLNLSHTSKRTRNEWLIDTLRQSGTLVWESSLRSFRCTTRSSMIPTPLTRLAFSLTCDVLWATSPASPAGPTSSAVLAICAICLFARRPVYRPASVGGGPYIDLVSQEVAHIEPDGPYIDIECHAIAGGGPYIDLLFERGGLYIDPAFAGGGPYIDLLFKAGARIDLLLPLRGSWPTRITQGHQNTRGTKTNRQHT
jgi:hypothetical protein